MGSIINRIKDETDFINSQFIRKPGRWFVEVCNGEQCVAGGGLMRSIRPRGPMLHVTPSLFLAAVLSPLSVLSIKAQESL